MHVRTLSLVGFRNYAELRFEPSNVLNVLVGSNAQGKSAILEACYLLATSKSHRAGRDTDMIRLGDSQSRVAADVVRQSRPDVSLDVVLSRTEKKSVKINTVRHARIGDLIGQLNAVIFSNEDIETVKGEPTQRRRFLNLEISQVSPQYVYALTRFKRTLEQRNNLLRENKMGLQSLSGLEAWDHQLVSYAATVIFRRREFVENLAPLAKRVHELLSAGAESFEIAYRPSIETQGQSEEDIAGAFASLLASRRNTDISRGTTTTGPHRDDMSMTINGIPAREYASQGQQRTAALALKLAEIELVKDAMHDTPVVLLDDVMAELDDTRRRMVLDMTGRQCQTIITTTHLADLFEEALAGAAVFEVASGEVRRK